MYGVLHQLRAIDLARICLVSHEYLPVEVDISTAQVDNANSNSKDVQSAVMSSCQSRTAVVLVSPPARQIVNTSQSTTKEVKENLVSAADEVGLPHDYCARLNQISCRSEDADLSEQTVALDGVDMREWARFWTGSDAVVPGAAGKRKRGRRGR